LTIRY